MSHWMLAKPTDFKTIMGWEGSSLDAEAERLLAAASSLVSEIAGRPVQRVVGRVEYPRPADEESLILRLDRFPIESIDQVIEATDTSSDQEFDELTPLAKDEDYFLADPVMARIERLGGFCWPFWPRSIRVTYTAGILDARGIRGSLVGGHVSGENSIDLQIDPVPVVGDTLIIDPDGSPQSVLVTGVNPLNTYDIDQDMISDHDNGTEVALYPQNAIQPDPHLQQAVLNQAIWWWNTRDKAGIRELDLGDRGGGVVLHESKTHPSLKSAAHMLRRYVI